MKFLSGTPNNLIFSTTSFNSFTPLVNVAFVILSAPTSVFWDSLSTIFALYKSIFSSFSIFSSALPSILIKSIIVFTIFSPTPSSAISFLTACSPILSILSIILKISTDLSFWPIPSNKPFKIFLLFIFIVKFSNPKVLKVE